jgi:hypothetical protein
MALLKGIYMTEVEWYNGTTWDKLMVNYKERETQLSAHSGHIILALNDTPAKALDSVKVDVNFSRLHMLEADSPKDDEYSAFHDKGIPTTTKSPIIRYKIAVGTWTTEEIITVNPTWHYMMLNASFPENAYTGGGTIETIAASSANVQLKFYFPAFTSSQLSKDELTLFRNLLGVARNWRVTNDGEGRTQTATPTSVIIATSPVTTGVTDYGLAKILVTLNVTLSFPVSGTYTLSATFQSNDGDSASELPGTHTITATIQVNTGSTTPFVCSLDDDVAMTIEIA